MDEEISAVELEALLESPDRPRIVDIRTAGEFERGHIPGSVNVPFADLPQRVGELVDATHVVTVCPHGIASKQAARLIASYEGTTADRVESLAGGMSEWDGPLDSTTPAQSGDDDGTQAPF